MDPQPLRPASPLMVMESNSFLHDEMLKLSIPGPTRDPVYYISDGNTVLLVDNTLFKVHRSTLMKDKSAFETMFQLTTEAGSGSAASSSSRSDCTMAAAEGDSDENPIRLPGDTADEFRALLWALYALPHEFMSATSSDANCAQLVKLARMSHKYQFRSIETWVMGTLQAYYARAGAFDAISTMSLPVLPHAGGGGAPADDTPSLVQITELAALCERPELLELALARWKKNIGEGKDLALAIAVGERLNLRPILGLAYHAMMLKGKAYWDIDAALSREQRVRLLSGYYTLTKLWDALPGAPPPLVHNVRCTSQQRCNKMFGHLWKATPRYIADLFPGLPKEDVLTKIMLMESMMKLFLEGAPPPGVVEQLPHCKENALMVTTVKVREFKENLTDYFSDEF